MRQCREPSAEPCLPCRQGGCSRTLVQHLFRDQCVHYSCSLVAVLGLYFEAVYPRRRLSLMSPLCVVSGPPRSPLSPFACSSLRSPFASERLTSPGVWVALARSGAQTYTSGAARFSSTTPQCDREESHRRTSRRFATNSEGSPWPELPCPTYLTDDVGGQQNANGAIVHRWVECRECGIEDHSTLTHGSER